ncbi:hypothetical protein HB770_04045 [Rhizobium leguminosarum bv. viciae]|uniref:Uncharacterized protein n=1 Tax=Rhizobium leguminosarum bv. viciae TaxID=387 RepID=A0A7G6RHT5_RHILV|nr:hypothetical protein HB770_04045 [Rhizobium leguminosarum bv. viciae]
MQKNTTVADRAAQIQKLKLEKLGRRNIAERLGCSEKQARSALEHLRSRPAQQPPKPDKPEKAKPARIAANNEVSADLAPSKVHRFILTAAQDDTPVFRPFLDNLYAYANHLDAQLLVA